MEFLLFFNMFLKIWVEIGNKLGGKNIKKNKVKYSNKKKTEVV